MRQVRRFAVPVFFFAGDMTGILPKLPRDAYPLPRSGGRERSNLSGTGSGGAEARLRLSNSKTPPWGHRGGVFVLGTRRSLSRFPPSEPSQSLDAQL